MAEQYQCSIHGVITDVTRFAFSSSILRDPDTEAYARVEKVYCTACICGFLDNNIMEVVEVPDEEKTDPSD